MATTPTFDQALTELELRLAEPLTSPSRIQAFLDNIPYSTEAIYRCPLRVLRERVAHCFDGALFAAAALRRIGYPPLILDLLPNDRDDDHLLALFKRDGLWGSVAKSNFVGLRFREPIYRTLRELVMSYFEQYFNIEREKTLRGYTVPLNLAQFDPANWMTNDAPLESIAQRLNRLRKISVLPQSRIAEFSLLDERSYRAGLLGGNEKGLFQPATKKS